MDRQSKLEKKLFRLQCFCVITTLTVVSLLFMGFKSNNKQKFSEIDVERINIVESDGKLRMVLSNQKRQHGGTMDGKTFERERPAGMLFFNEKGDEVGGLIFSGDNGQGQYNSLTFDKFRSDQTIALQHLENKDGEFFAGLSINDQNMPITDMVDKMEKIKLIKDEKERNAAMNASMKSGEMTVKRLALGKGRDKSAFLELRDAKGNPRIKISVAADGNPRMDFLDETGKAIQSFPNTQK
ncbi:MAG: hypothetical protein WBO10_04925 [Pyrinomonadaceae bacterium]